MSLWNSSGMCVKHGATKRDRFTIQQEQKKFLLI